MSLTHPRIRIFITNINLDAAFGVANGPSDYIIVSETIFDLTNDILNDDTWDLDDVQSPLRPQLDKATSQYPPSTPFEKSDSLMVPVPFHPAAYSGQHRRTILSREMMPLAQGNLKVKVLRMRVRFSSAGSSTHAASAFIYPRTKYLTGSLTLTLSSTTKQPPRKH